MKGRREKHEKTSWNFEDIFWCITTSTTLFLNCCYIWVPRSIHSRLIPILFFTTFILTREEESSSKSLINCVIVRINQFCRTFLPWLATECVTMMTKIQLTICVTTECQTINYEKSNVVWVNMVNCYYYYYYFLLLSF